MKSKERQPNNNSGRQAYVVLMALTLIRQRGRTGSLEIQARLAEKGMSYSVRAIQRWLKNAADNHIPIEGDCHSPKGWQWKKDMTADERAMAETVWALREAA
mgnify:FL=1